MEVARIMSQPIGRLARMAAGLMLIILGQFVIGGGLGLVVALIGLAPLLAGTRNVCLVGSLLGAPLRARDPPPASNES